MSLLTAQTKRPPARTRCETLAAVTPAEEPTDVEEQYKSHERWAELESRCDALIERLKDLDLPKEVPGLLIADVEMVNAALNEARSAIVGLGLLGASKLDGEDVSSEAVRKEWATSEEHLRGLSEEVEYGWESKSPKAPILLREIIEAFGATRDDFEDLVEPFM